MSDKGAATIGITLPSEMRYPVLQAAATATTDQENTR